MSSAWDLRTFRERVATRIETEIAKQRTTLAELGPDMSPLVDSVADLLTGGKRFRAAFAQAGYVAGGGGHDEEMLSVATAMELFQAAALLHDDVMDDSATRRGRATAHRAFAATHRRRGWSGDADRFGVAGAILAGDLCLCWCDDMVAGSGLPTDELARGRAVYDTMRTQLMGGQFLDMLVAMRGWDGLATTQRLDQTRQVIRYKSAKYSIEQPLLIGARAAGVEGADVAHLSTYGLALGEAFQLRDDVLGVFGDPETTGKPAGDDLREGKRTMPLALTLDGLDAADRDAVTSRLGRADLTASDVDEMRDLVRSSGALERHEEIIEAATQQARRALAATTGLTEAGRAALGELIDLTTDRAS